MGNLILRSLMLLSLFLGGAAGADEKYQVDKVKCLMLKDPLSCQKLATLTLNTQDGPKYEYVGCTEANDGKSCYGLAERLTQPAQAATALTYYTLACDRGYTLSCIKQVQLSWKAAANGTVAGKAAVQAYAQKVATRCKDSKDTECEQIRRELESINRSVDNKFQDCRLSLATWTNAQEVPDTEVFPLEREATVSACQQSCKLRELRIKAKSDTAFLRTACDFGDQSANPPSWKSAKPPDRECPAGAQEFTKGVPFYRTCYCQNLEHHPLNDLLLPMEAVAVSGASLSKRIGKVSWSRCTVALKYTKAPAPKDCAAKLKKIKEAVAASGEAKYFEVDASGLTCHEESGVEKRF